MNEDDRESDEIVSNKKILYNKNRKDTITNCMMNYDAYFS